MGRNASGDAIGEVWNFGGANARVVEPTDVESKSSIQDPQTPSYELWLQNRGVNKPRSFTRTITVRQIIGEGGMEYPDGLAGSPLQDTSKLAEDVAR